MYVVTQVEANVMALTALGNITHSGQTFMIKVKVMCTLGWPGGEVKVIIKNPRPYSSLSWL